MEKDDPADRRKDRLIQARVPRDLESTLKREARRRRLTVSHLIRNVLEDTFQLVDDVVANVDDIVSDSVQLARRVGRDARRMADAVREAVSEPDDDGAETLSDDAGDASAESESEESESQESEVETPDPLDSIYAWNPVILNRAAQCSRCAAHLERGGEAFVGLADEPGAPRAWLCRACREVL